MRYMLLIYLDEKLNDMSPEAMAKWEAFTQEVTDAGVYEDGRAPARLHGDGGARARW